MFIWRSNPSKLQKHRIKVEAFYGPYEWVFTKKIAKVLLRGKTEPVLPTFGLAKQREEAFNSPNQKRAAREAALKVFYLREGKLRVRQCDRKTFKKIENFNVLTSNIAAGLQRFKKLALKILGLYRTTGIQKPCSFQCEMYAFFFCSSNLIPSQADKVGMTGS